MKTRLELGSLGIIEGDKKRALEDYVTPSLFTQRKTYDEYYIEVTNFEVTLDFGDLTILAENFTVRVLQDGGVILS